MDAEGSTEWDDAGQGCRGHPGALLVSVVVSVVVWTFGEIVLFPGLNAAVADLAPGARRGEYMGLYMTALNLAFATAGSGVLWSDSLWDTDQSWVLYDVAGTTTHLSNLSLTTSNWLDSGGNDFNTGLPDGSFSLILSGNDVVLNYSAIPEPGTTLLGSLSLIALFRRRRTHS